MDIITNNRPRLLMNWYELTAKEQQDFDYLKPEDQPCAEFVRFKGRIYDLGEFMTAPKELKALGWEGFSGDSYFSGTLMRFADSDHVVMARCYS